MGADVDFFWDPMCPWAWIGSRWVADVADRRGLEVQWRFISLRLVNEGRDYDAEFPDGYLEHHDRSLRLLRVAARIRRDLNDKAVGYYYTALGTLIHEQHRHEELDPVGSATLRDAIVGVGGHPDWVTSADDETFDPVIKEDVDLAIARVGIEAGTPIMTLDPPDGPSIFGPVLSRRVLGDEADELWDATVVIAREDGLSEIKRRRPRFSSFDTFPIRRAAASDAEADEGCVLPGAVSTASEGSGTT